MADAKVYRDSKNRVTMVDGGEEKRNAEINQAELMIRIVEATSGNKRPKGMTADQCINDAFGLDQETLDFLDKASMAAIEYFAEVLAGGTLTQ